MCFCFVFVFVLWRQRKALPKQSGTVAQALLRHCQSKRNFRKSRKSRAGSGKTARFRSRKMCTFSFVFFRFCFFFFPEFFVFFRIFPEFFRNFPQMITNPVQSGEKSGAKPRKAETKPLKTGQKPSKKRRKPARKRKPNRRGRRAKSGVGRKEGRMVSRRNSFFCTKKHRTPVGANCVRPAKF